MRVLFSIAMMTSFLWIGKWRVASAESWTLTDSGFVISADFGMEIIEQEETGSTVALAKELHELCPNDPNSIAVSVGLIERFTGPFFTLTAFELRGSDPETFFTACQGAGYYPFSNQVLLVELMTHTGARWAGLVSTIHAVGVDVGGNGTADVVMNTFSTGNSRTGGVTFIEVSSDGKIHVDDDLAVFDYFIYVTDRNRDSIYELHTALERWHGSGFSSHAQVSWVEVYLERKNGSWRLDSANMVRDPEDFWFNKEFRGEIVSLSLNQLISPQFRDPLSPLELMDLLDLLVYSGNASLVHTVTDSLFPVLKLHEDESLTRVEFDSAFWFGLCFPNCLDRINAMSLPNPEFGDYRP